MFVYPDGKIVSAEGRTEGYITYEPKGEGGFGYDPVFFSDELVIETTVVHLGNKSMTLLQRAVNKSSGVLKCQCRTVLVGYDVTTKEPIPIPMMYKKAICDYEGKTLEELSKK